MPADPTASRPHLPTAYGLPKSAPFVSWAAINDRLTCALHYWICTVRADGSPIARPIDGMWIDNALYFGGHPDTRWRRNLDANPRASITLADGERAVMLEGTVTQTTPEGGLALILAEQANAKYEWANQTADDYQDSLCMFTPSNALAWDMLYKDATRFRFTT